MIASDRSLIAIGFGLRLTLSAAISYVDNGHHLYHLHRYTTLHRDDLESADKGWRNWRLRSFSEVFDDMHMMVASGGKSLTPTPLELHDHALKSKAQSSDLVRGNKDVFSPGNLGLPALTPITRERDSIFSTLPGEIDTFPGRALRPNCGV
jgi:hypothetical protein